MAAILGYIAAMALHAVEIIRTVPARTLVVAGRSFAAPLAAMVAVLGWITMMTNLFAVNLLANGLHSYAGL